MKLTMHFSKVKYFRVFWIPAFAGNKSKSAGQTEPVVRENTDGRVVGNLYSIIV